MLSAEGPKPTRSRRLLLILVAFVALRAVASHPGVIDVDLHNFFAQASAAVAGQRPYVDFAFEYPPGALLLMLGPRLLTANIHTYALLFMLQMALLDLLTLAALIRLVRLLRPPPVDPGNAAREELVTVAAYLISSSLLGLLVLQRMDLALGAILSWFVVLQIARGGAAAALLALGTWIKLTPAVLLPLALVHQIRRRVAAGEGTRIGDAVSRSWPIVAWYCGALAVLSLPFAWISGAGLARFLAPLSSRGLQVESSYASVLLVLHHVFSGKLALAHRFGSWQVDGARWSFLARLSTWITGATQLSILIWYARASGRAASRDEQDRLLVRASIVSIMALLLTSKVFSAQFLLWVAPLLAALAGPLRARAGRLVPWVLGAFVLTGVYTHLLYRKLLALKLLPALLLLARNALLAGVTVALIWRPTRCRATGDPDQPAAAR